MHAQFILPLFLAGTALGQFVLDQFPSPDTGLNTAGNYHGCDIADGISCTYNSGGGLTILSTDTDYSFYTQLNNGGCQDITSFAGQYLHIKYSGSNQFSIALQQNNVGCNPDIAPYPETWDVVNAVDYSNNGDIYVPLDHFDIIKTRAIGFALKAFRDPTTSTTFTLVEIVSALPGGFSVPTKKPTGPIYFACTRPNSIAFGIDDGVPELAQRTMDIIAAEGIKVTFFTVGNALDDATEPFTALYKKAAADGHQIALHSYTHPKMESLNDINAIDTEFSKSHQSTLNNIGVDSKYFRAPYGTDGALTRQRLEAVIPGSRVINWSVDVEDWLWAESATPEKQTDAVVRDLAKGGNLVVMHYLYTSTVDQFQGFIQLAKAKGLDIMRVDQCLGDPNAPPYP